eukprot:Clim_evm20s33 gene=Clim_evmTU20s33
MASYGLESLELRVGSSQTNQSQPYHISECLGSLAVLGPHEIAIIVALLDQDSYVELIRATHLALRKPPYVYDLPSPVGTLSLTQWPKTRSRDLVANSGGVRRSFAPGRPRSPRTTVAGRGSRSGSSAAGRLSTPPDLWTREYLTEHCVTLIVGALSRRLEHSDVLHHELTVARKRYAVDQKATLRVVLKTGKNMFHTGQRVYDQLDALDDIMERLRELGIAVVAFKLKYGESAIDLGGVPSVRSEPPAYMAGASPSPSSNLVSNKDNKDEGDDRDAMVQSQHTGPNVCLFAWLCQRRTTVPFYVLDVDGRHVDLAHEFGSRSPNGLADVYLRLKLCPLLVVPLLPFQTHHWVIEKIMYPLQETLRDLRTRTEFQGFADEIVSHGFPLFEARGASRVAAFCKAALLRFARVQKPSLGTEGNMSQSQSQSVSPSRPHRVNDRPSSRRYVKKNTAPAFMSGTAYPELRSFMRWAWLMQLFDGRGLRDGESPCSTLETRDGFILCEPFLQAATVMDTLGDTHITVSMAVHARRKVRQQSRQQSMKMHSDNDDESALMSPTLHELVSPQPGDHIFELRAAPDLPYVPDFYAQQSLGHEPNRELWWAWAREEEDFYTM